MQFLGVSLAVLLIGMFLVLAFLDEHRQRPNYREVCKDLAKELMEQRGKRWDAEARAIRLEARKEKAEAQLVEVWRELADQEIRLTDAAVPTVRLPSSSKTHENAPTQQNG